MNICIKKIEEKDKPELEKIYIQTVQQEFPEYSQQIRDHFTSGAYKQSMLGKHIKIGVFDDKKLIGFLLADDPIGGVMFIFWLGIIPNYQGKGLGTELVHYIEKMALKMGVHNIQLQADERNVSFYKHLGFEILGFDAKGYFGADSYIMKKLIQEPRPESFFN